MLVAGDQPGDLAQWRQNAAAQHVAGHQRADAELAGNDDVHPADDGGHAGKLLQEQCAVGGYGGQRAGVDIQAGEGTMGFLPLVLALAFSAAGFQGFQAAECFNQQGLTL